MAINITRWNPDTCGCVIEYSWDSETTEDNRTHTFHKVINQCDDHGDIEDHQDVHDHVKDENQTKNLALAKLLENVPRLKKNNDLDPTVSFNWQFSGKNKERQLKVTLANANLTTPEKVKLMQAISTLKKSVTVV